MDLDDDSELVVDPARRDLAESEDLPAWIFDIEREEMVWANAPALRLWEADSLEDLLERDFSSDMSAATRQRLSRYQAVLAHGESLGETWTFYPQGQPRTVMCQCSPVRLADGRLAMRVDGIAGVGGLDESALRTLESVHHADLLLILHDDRGRVLLRNPAAIAVLRDAGTFGDHFQRAEDRDALWAQVEQHGEAAREVPVERTTGPGWHVVQVRRVRDPVTGGDLRLATEYDITDHHQAREELATANELIATLVDSLSIGVLFEDEDRIIRLANPAFCELFGMTCSPQDLIGQHCGGLLAAARGDMADPDGFEHRIETLVEQREPVTGDEWELRDGRVVALNYRSVNVGRRYGGHLWQYWDVTDRHHTEVRLQEQATRDWLTGLPNHRAVMQALRAARRDAAEAGRRSAVLMIDIDHFKQVNDVFGHAVGDRILVEIGKAVRAVLRHSDFLGRLGGEEFLALLPDIDLDSARESATRVQRATSVQSCCTPDGRPVTVSVGLSLVEPGAGETAEQIMERADRALYAAKGAGRDRVMEALE